MSVLSHVFQILFLCHISSPVMSVDDCIIQEDRCSCKFKNNSIISLKGLPTAKPPRFSDKVPLLKPSPGETYFYDPCFPFKEGSKANDHPKDDCYNSDNVVVCQQNNGAFWNLGDLSSAEFKYNKTNWYIAYNHTHRFTNVSLMCSDQEKPNLIVLGENNGTSHYHFLLYSKCACVDGCVPTPSDDDDSRAGMSTFQFFILFIFLGILFYFVGGMVYRKMRYGAAGREMIPHYEFWSTCGVKLRELVRYLASGCKTSQDSNYDQI